MYMGMMAGAEDLPVTQYRTEVATIAAQAMSRKYNALSRCAFDKMNLTGASNRYVAKQANKMIIQNLGRMNSGLPGVFRWLAAFGILLCACWRWICVLGYFV